MIIVVGRTKIIIIVLVVIIIIISVLLWRLTMPFTSHKLAHHNQHINQPERGRVTFILIFLTYLIQKKRESASATASVLKNWSRSVTFPSSESRSSHPFSLEEGLRGLQGKFGFCLSKNIKIGPFRLPSPLPLPAWALPQGKQHSSTDKRGAETEEQRAQSGAHGSERACYALGFCWETGPFGS